MLKQVDDEVARRREVEALRLLGRPSVRLLDDGPARLRPAGLLPDDGPAGLLLERVEPGTSAAELPDDEATRLLAGAMRSMWRPVPAGCGLPTVEQECAPLLLDVGLPAEVVATARAALSVLLASSPEPAVLHGDLHHGNLLLGATGWVAIDPHGVTGDPSYDVGPLLLNPHTRDVSGLVGRRLDLLAELLGTPRERLRQWGLVRAVLACSWAAEAGEPAPPGFLAVAHALVSA